MQQHILLVGIQGSGKGTMARKIVETYGTHFFEMGQKLRAFAELSEPESATVKALLGEGKLVGNDLVEKILLHYRESHGASPIVFDGIPRSKEQKELFDRVFSDYIVIFLDLTKDKAIERLANRRIDPITGESFPSNFVGDFSPFTGNKLVHREDDNPEAVARRIDTFYANTLPLLALWAHDEKRVYHIDASSDIETCFGQIRAILSAYFSVNVQI